MSKTATDIRTSAVSGGWPKHFNYAAKSNVGNASAAPLGTGARFAALKSKLATQSGITDPGALAASIGRKKYGAKRMAKWSAAGR